ncbi:hypothetical protein GUJ93_ZPchr0007g3654 [Zizania palustris]|uniref:Uncharacterized protein n=1 Tax=Zizania palustris TaxID=103762 RepID=A0A8J5VZ15_ZIZPA|nr:hypothetical protein GUJ93_ZPchr0007g3654 [Zizania palustris]
MVVVAVEEVQNVTRVAVVAAVIEEHLKMLGRMGLGEVGVGVGVEHLNLVLVVEEVQVEHFCQNLTLEGEEEGVGEKCLTSLMKIEEVAVVVAAAAAVL